MGISTNSSSQGIWPVCWWKILEDKCKQTLYYYLPLNLKLYYI